MSSLFELDWGGFQRTEVPVCGEQIPRRGRDAAASSYQRPLTFENNALTKAALRLKGKSVERNVLGQKRGLLLISGWQTRSWLAEIVAIEWMVECGCQVWGEKYDPKSGMTAPPRSVQERRYLLLFQSKQHLNSSRETLQNIF